MNSDQDPVVTKIKVARLFNLGNYEHERIEVTVCARGVLGEMTPCPIKEPGSVLIEVQRLLEQASPVSMTAEAIAGKRLETCELNVRPDDAPWDSNSVTQTEAVECAKALEQYRIACTLRKAALQKLNDLGSVVTTEGVVK